MLKNNICPYCSNMLVLFGSDVDVPRRASVEHLIPNVALSQKRGNGEGDFMACKTCNCDKSNLDYVIGTIAKLNSSNSDMIISALEKALGDNKKSNPYSNMLLSGRKGSNASTVELSLPITHDQIHTYATYLAKGQYFKEHESPLCLKNKKIEWELLSNQFTSYLTDGYSSAFDDLIQNPNSENILNGECIIYSRNNKYMFVFQRGLIFIISILDDSL